MPIPWERHKGVLLTEKPTISRRPQHNQQGFPLPEVSGKALLKCEVTPKSCSVPIFIRGEEMRFPLSRLDCLSGTEICLHSYTNSHVWTQLDIFTDHFLKGTLEKLLLCFHLSLIGFVLFCFLKWSMNKYMSTQQLSTAICCVTILYLNLRCSDS